MLCRRMYSCSLCCSRALRAQVGVGDIIGNPLAQALDKAVRSRSVGDQVELELQGGEYKRDLVFTVPLDHQEVQRLQGRYSSCALAWSFVWLHTHMFCNHKVS